MKSTSRRGTTSGTSAGSSFPGACESSPPGTPMRSSVPRSGRPMASASWWCSTGTTNRFASRSARATSSRRSNRRRTASRRSCSDARLGRFVPRTRTWVGLNTQTPRVSGESQRRGVCAQTLRASRSHQHTRARPVLLSAKHSALPVDIAILLLEWSCTLTSRTYPVKRSSGPWKRSGKRSRKRTPPPNHLHGTQMRSPG